MNRGRRREEICPAPEDFRVFVELLKECAEQWQVGISAYCLLSNHYHLLIQTPAGNLSRFMRHLNGVYTQRYNRAHDCDGQLFRGRYKAILVEEDRYLLELVRYIHRNPLNAGIVEDIDQYAWSSHHDYLTDTTGASWLHKDFVLAMLSENANRRRKTYQHFVALEEPEEVSAIFDKKKWPAILGSECFVDQIRARFFADKQHQQVPDAAQLAPEAARIIAAVCQHYDVEQSQLMRSVRGMTNEPRNVAIYLMRTLRRDGLLSIGALFGMGGYSSASSAIERIRHQLTTDRELQRRINRIREQLAVSKSRT
ncbi:MAG: transposase [Desulfuromonadales bacterium]|nr:transposase [Desulfuromonadales bacterium]